MSEDLQKLRQIFEATCNVQVCSYFEEMPADSSKNLVRAAEVKVVHGVGAGYSGEEQETELAEMHAKFADYIAMDEQYIPVLQSIVQRQSVSEVSSDLNFMLAYFLRESSFAEMVEHRSKLFTAILSVMEYLSSHTSTRGTLQAVHNKNGDLILALRGKKEAAGTYIRCIKDESSDLLLSAHKNIAQEFQNQIEKVLASNSGAAEEKYFDGGSEVKDSTDSDKLGRWLKSRQFVFGNILEHHSYAHSSDIGEPISKKKLLRLKKEISILSNSLPDGVFVCVDENRFDVMKVMIVGPQGTPYENGCFLFDLYLPANFPSSSPQMKYLTTGGGSYYFNPNLYQDGKVCLSLLGTWEGPGWNENTSTILQLLVSLHGMVLVDYPLENEPGYEGYALQPDSLAYNEGIRMATLLYAMTWHFTNPDPATYFQDECKVHLYLQKDYLQSQLTQWEAIPKCEKDCSYFPHRKLFKNNEFSKLKEDFLSLLSNPPKLDQAFVSK